VLFAQFAAECEQAVRDDVDYIITERTVLDWWLYYLWTCEHVHVEPVSYLDQLVAEWVRSYDLIFWLDDSQMEYIDDGFRPATTRIRDDMVTRYDWGLTWLRNQTLASKIRLITVPDVVERCEQIEGLFKEWFDEHKKQRRGAASLLSHRMGKVL
jgi:hypothetical protein